MIQKGGSETELYPSVFDTKEEAEAHIDDCWENGAYECLGPLELIVRAVRAEACVEVAKEILKMRAQTPSDCQHVLDLVLRSMQQHGLIGPFSPAQGKVNAAPME